MAMVMWVNGRFVHPGEGVVSAADQGLTMGMGVYETVAVLGGRPFALSRHLRRLAASATGLGLAAPDETLVHDGVGAVGQEMTGWELGRLRIMVTAGAGEPGADGAGAGQAVIVTGSPAHEAPRCRVVRSPWVRNERSAVAGLKTTSLAEGTVALADARRRGADEGLLANTVGELCEATRANVFVERGGELVTPALASGCLAGITRELLLEWGGELGLPVREAAVGELSYAVLDEVAGLVGVGPVGAGSAGLGGAGSAGAGSAGLGGAGSAGAGGDARAHGVGGGAGADGGSGGGDRLDGGAATGRAYLLLTGSVRHVQPVMSLDGAGVAVGELSALARDRFAARVAEDMNP
jgi:branched-chain amino acid aminotransferase